VFKFITLALLFTLISASSLGGREIDLNKLSSEAAEQHKHLLVWLHKTDCGYCESMREFTLEDDAVADLLKQSFLFVQINVSENDTVTYKTFKGSGKAFAVRIGYNFYPSSLFLNESADIIFAAAGYIEEGDFKKMLTFVESGRYKIMSYDAFRQQENKR